MLRLIVVLTMLLATMAHAEVDSYEACVTLTDGERKLRACTAIIHDERGTSPAIRAGALIVRGNVYTRRHWYHRAIADYTRAIELDSQRARAYLFRGLAHIKTGQYDRAEADFNRLLALRPDLAPPCVDCDK